MEANHQQIEEQQHRPVSPMKADNASLPPGSKSITSIEGAVPSIAAMEDGSSEGSVACSDETHDSMVTVPLSGPPSLAIDTSLVSQQIPVGSSSLRKTVESFDQLADATNDTPEAKERQEDDTPRDDAPRTLDDELRDYEERADDEPDRAEQSTPTPPSPRSEDGVNWDKLQETEDAEPKTAATDDSTKSLLARLDLENAKLTISPTNDRTRAPEHNEAQSPPPAQPPSITQLKKMVQGPTPQALRYSMLPPPPMTDLEFYAALVKDYQQTAERLPTLLLNKVRKGIPPPLRGVVWQSMSGAARDMALEERYDQLCNESSPYEFVISKDLARSFPGVDMFREPGGDGQRMLGRVLKAFSIYDREIGYCQGLAFLVGPLLMHMPDKAAFCVLVRLMERYDLRSSFQPDLAGLHVRIHQFHTLLREHLPALAAHLDDLQVDPAYVSQWFLSFFAATCPLPMLFRIYDVALAEGAVATLVRVALALMARSEARLMACAELETAVQLLLSRGVWDPYNYNADLFVEDFTSWTPVVTSQRLSELEAEYYELQKLKRKQEEEAQQQQDSNSPTQSAPRPAPAVQAIRAAAAHDGDTGAGSAPRASEVINAAASRFLGRGSPSPASSPTSSSSSKQSTLSPRLGPPSAPISMLRRSTSKRSVASTLDSMAASSASVMSSASTAATSVSRDSDSGDEKTTVNNATATAVTTTTTTTTTNTSSSNNTNNTTTARPDLNSNTNNNNNNTHGRGGGGGGSEERHLHSQIEDLLMALSEMQRSHAQLEADLKRERDARSEDADAARELTWLVSNSSAAASLRTDPGVEALLRSVEERFSAAGDGSAGGGNASAGTPPSSSEPSKTELREELEEARAKLAGALAEAQGYSRRIYELDQEVTSLKLSVRESHAHVRGLHQEKQRLEKQVHSMRTRASAASSHSNHTLNGNGSIFDGQGGADADRSRTSTLGNGLREFKLGRSNSPPSTSAGFSKRSSSLAVNGGAGGGAAGGGASGDSEALLKELARAKTAEAMARQEADEARQKLETLRRQYGIPAGGPSEAGAFGQMSVSGAAASAAQAAQAAQTAAMSIFGRVTAPAAAGGGGAGGGGNGGGFWGWRR